MSSEHKVCVYSVASTDEDRRGREIVLLIPQDDVYALQSFKLSEFFPFNHFMANWFTSLNSPYLICSSCCIMHYSNYLFAVFLSINMLIANLHCDIFTLLHLVRSSLSLCLAVVPVLLHALVLTLKLLVVYVPTLTKKTHCSFCFAAR